MHFSILIQLSLDHTEKMAVRKEAAKEAKGNIKIE